MYHTFVVEREHTKLCGNIMTVRVLIDMTIETGFTFPGKAAHGTWQMMLNILYLCEVIKSSLLSRHIRKWCHAKYDSYSYCKRVLTIQSVKLTSDVFVITTAADVRIIYTKYVRKANHWRFCNCCRFSPSRSPAIKHNQIPIVLLI